MPEYKLVPVEPTAAQTRAAPQPVQEPVAWLYEFNGLGKELLFPDEIEEDAFNTHPDWYKPLVFGSAPDQGVGIDGPIRAVADHVTVREEQYAEIERLVSLLTERSREIGCLISKMVEMEQERDTLREQVRVLNNVYERAFDVMEGIEDMKLPGSVPARVIKLRAALAAVKQEGGAA